MLRNTGSADVPPKKPPLSWPEGVPRFVVRRAEDRRFFVYDLLHERRCSSLTIDPREAEDVMRECERVAARDRLR